MKKLINPAVTTPAFRAPELPELNAAQRANLFSYLIITKEGMDKLAEQNRENEDVLNVQCAFEVALSTLLDGSETVDEYLSRDTKVKHTNIGGFIVSEEQGIASFVCPNCGMQTMFPASEENMDLIKDTCVPDCCAVCNSKKVSPKEKLGRIIFGGDKF